MQISRDRFLVLVSVLAAGGCGAQPPSPAPITPMGSTGPATIVSSTPAAPPVSGAESAGVELLGDLDPDLPGPTCEAALDVPMPGHEEDHPHVRLGALQVNGRMDPRAIESTILRAGRGSIGKCFEAELGSVQDQRRIAVRVVVREDGFREVNSEAGAGRLQLCVESVIRALPLGKPESGLTTMIIPMMFRKRMFVPDRTRVAEWSERINAPCRKK